MTVDILKWLVLYLLVLFAFGCGMNQLLWYYADLEYDKCYSLPGGLPNVEGEVTTRQAMKVMYLHQESMHLNCKLKSQNSLKSEWLSMIFYRESLDAHNAYLFISALFPLFSLTTFYLLLQLSYWLATSSSTYNYLPFKRLFWTIHHLYLHVKVYLTSIFFHYLCPFAFSLFWKERNNLSFLFSPPMYLQSNACIVWRRFANLFETSQSLFWASFGLVSLTDFELTGIKEFTRFWALLMFGSYSVCNIIVLLNMLIAMMSNSFQVRIHRVQVD